MRIRQGMRSRPGKRLAAMEDPIAEARVRFAMFCLWIHKMADGGELAARYNRPTKWVEDWIDRKCPLFE